jgi:hypothetical protein
VRTRKLEKFSVSSVAELPETAWTRRLVRLEADRSSVPLPVARKAVARRAGIPPGAVEHIERGRAKRVGRRVYEALRGLVLRELEREITALEYELAKARQCGVDAREEQICAVDTHIARAREAMEALK